jgi:hypothetical protein
VDSDSRTPSTAQIGHAIITTDISTSGGTAGSPLIELLTGRVIGMSYAGQWQGERGKFAYADPIPRPALDLIATRAQGEAEPGVAPKTGNEIQLR